MHKLRPEKNPKIEDLAVAGRESPGRLNTIAEKGGKIEVISKLGGKGW